MSKIKLTELKNVLKYWNEKQIKNGHLNRQYKQQLKNLCTGRSSSGCYPGNYQYMQEALSNVEERIRFIYVQWQMKEGRNSKKWGKDNIWRQNTWEFSKINERYQSSDQ